MYPAGVPGISVRRVTVAGNGLRILESGLPGEHAVVLVHGWGASAYSFAEMIPRLAAAGQRVVALDLPGSGLSDKPVAEHHYTTRALADAVLGVVRSVGARTFTLVGHSMGGSIALDVACRQTPGLARLVLINAVGLGTVPVIALLKVLSPRVVNRVTPHLLPRFVVRRILRMVFATSGRPTERDIDEYWAPTQFPEFAWACRASAHGVNWRPAPADDLRSLAMPVLVIAGGRDPWVRRTTARARLIPHARVVRISEGGHLALQECAEQVAGEIVTFLSDHPVE